MSLSNETGKLSKGAFRIGDPPGQQVIRFQWNPDTLTRTLAPSGGDDQRAGLRFPSPARITLSLEIELDAALLPQSEEVTRYGVAPALAAIERLLGPSVRSLMDADMAAGRGAINILLAAPPAVYFEWGQRFCVPVAFSEFSITEQAFGPTLYPVRAQARIGLRVLTHEELGTTSESGKHYLNYLQNVESLAGRYRP